MPNKSLEYAPSGPDALTRAAQFRRSAKLNMISRRQLLYLSALFSFWYPFANSKCFAVAEEKINNNSYFLTIDILKEAYWAEIIASKHYDAFCERALSEKFPNIAYLFSTLSISEKIHADNYEKLISSLGATFPKREIPIAVTDTKSNLKIASMKELEKIEKFYPNVLKNLQPESHDQAIINCVYSWKSHQQHEEMINDIRRYSGFFFRTLAKKIESMKPNDYVCEICGSTINEKPKNPCEICNYALYHYKNIKRPILSAN